MTTKEQTKEKSENFVVCNIDIFPKDLYTGYMSDIGKEGGSSTLQRRLSRSQRVRPESHDPGRRGLLKAGVAAVALGALGQTEQAGQILNTVGEIINNTTNPIQPISIEKGSLVDTIQVFDEGKNEAEKQQMVLVTDRQVIGEAKLRTRPTPGSLQLGTLPSGYLIPLGEIIKGEPTRQANHLPPNEKWLKMYWRYPDGTQIPVYTHLPNTIPQNPK
ncbi:MAG: hypothetical protein C4584_00445 [Armatimonadetes bacterium]|nr:MAG: hypothetical protein C4584_00445 [Armatimonadota bacterium]